MLSQLWLLFALVSICNAAALPQLRGKHLNPRLADPRNSERHLAENYVRRSSQGCGVLVPLELLDSSYIGNISIGSQSQTVPIMFDLNVSQLSALSPTVQYCSPSHDCEPRNTRINSYNPALSHSAKNLSETFEVTMSNATFTGVLYQDSVSIGGVTISNQSFGLTHEIRGRQAALSSTSHQYSGVAGLSGWSEDDPGFGNTPSFLRSLAMYGPIEVPGFSLWMNPATFNGELLLGAVDASKYTSPLYQFDLVSPGSWYSIYLTKISSYTGSTTGLSQIETVFDTTTDSIILPISWSSSLKAIFDADLDQNSTLLLPCTSATEVLDVIFFVGNGIPISIPLSTFVGEPTGTDGMCVSPISFTDSNQYVLGTSFLRYVYLVLNSDGSQGAVAQANFLESDSDLTSMTSNTPLPSAVSFMSTINDSNSTTINESNTTTISNATDLGNGTAFNTQFVLLATTGQVITETIVTTVTSEGSTSTLTTTVTSTIPTSEITTTSTSDLSPSTSLTLPIVNFAVTTSIQVITETILTTITSDMSTTVFTTTLTSTVSSAATTATDPATDSATTPAVEHAVSTTSTINLTTGTNTLPNFVVSVFTFTYSNFSATTMTVTGSSPRTFEEILASAATTSTDPSSNPPTSPISIATSTNPIDDHIVSATTTDPVKDGIATTGAISYGTYSPSTGPGMSTTNPSIHGFNVPFTSRSSPNPNYASPWPSAPLNINIFVQNSIILTTTRNYVPDGSADVLTVTSTATVTTTVPCSTDPGTLETLTAKVLQILIVPSPTPYVDPECTCTKSDITYVDDNVTKTIYVDNTTASLDPTQHPYPHSVCECDDCYYTVKKTATVTMTCTAAPATTSAAPLPQFVSGASTITPAVKLVGIFAMAMTMVLFR